MMHIIATHTQSGSYLLEVRYCLPSFHRRTDRSPHMGQQTDSLQLSFVPPAERNLG